MAVPKVVLYVDDDAPNLELFRRTFDELTEVAVASGGAEALERLSEGDVAVLVTDQRMPHMTGIELLSRARVEHPDVARMLLTAYADRELLLAAIREGEVHDYVLKPWDAEELELRLRRALDLHAAARRTSEAVRERDALRDEISERAPHGDIVGLDGDLSPLSQVLARVARSDSTVMLRGETGTGKELFARRIHALSARAERPFVRVNCSALAESLLESELFGHEAGAFTGARGRRIGRLEQAHGGTLFLDEIGDVQPAVQVKLLRAIQEREIERVGGNRTLRVDVRFVAATHRDLEALVEEGRFREDLYHRLHVVPLRIPPLRERASDLPRLVHHLVRAAGARVGREVTISSDAVVMLAGYDWPGNVRELSNVIERAVVLADDGATLEREDLLMDFARATRASAPEPTNVSTQVSEELERAELARVRDALLRASGNKARAAALLGIPRTTLADRIRRLGIR